MLLVFVTESIVSHSSGIGGPLQPSENAPNIFEAQEEIGKDNQLKSVLSCSICFPTETQTEITKNSSANKSIHFTFITLKNSI